MRKSFYKCIAAAAAISFLLSGCGGNIAARQETEEPDPSTSASGNLTDLFDEESQGKELAGFSYGWSDAPDVITYSGEAVSIPFRLADATGELPLELGLVLLVDGIAQPYSVVFDNGTELPEAYMQTFHLEEDTESLFDLVFQPVTGQVGDTLSVQALTILKPSYLPAGIENPNYGVYHSANLTLPLQIAYKADATAEEPRIADNSYEIVDIPKSVTDANEYFGIEDTMDTNNYLSIVPADGEDGSDPVLYSKDGHVTFKIRLYGGPEADNNITVFVNHQPVRINGADYLAVRTEKGKMVEATVTLDTSSLGTMNTLYAIASSTGRDSNLTETLKSDSVLLVNQEGN